MRVHWAPKQASNILVGAADGCVRLSDLGVAAKLDRHFAAREASAFATLTRRNTFIGSPAFMAPEVLCGSEQGCAPPLPAVEGAHVCKP